MGDLVVDAFAAYRLTHLVVSDTITARPRAAIIESAYRAQARREHTTLSQRIGQPRRAMTVDGWPELALAEGVDAPKLATLVSCPACAGVWVGLGVVLARRVLPGWRHLARALAVAGGAHLLQRLR